MNKANPTNMSRRGLRCCAGGKADRRGSAIVLVLVSIVLMALLAATLLQVTRFERIPRPVSNIDIVVESVVDEILNQATDDLLNDNGDMFNPRIRNGGGDEPWDFPWTNRNITNARTAESINGGRVNVLGGAMDDTWLAAHAPDFRNSVSEGVYASGANDTANGVWRQITDLTGMYLTNANGYTDLSANAQPTERALTAARIGLKTNNRALNVGRTNAAGDVTDTLIDADGDGIGDSRWEWAPIRQIGTTRYTMAVRIVDLSARMDVNVAIGQYDDTRNFNTDPAARIGGNDLPFYGRGDGPTELDGAGFVASHAAASGINPTTARNDWRNALGFRMTGNPATSLGGTPSYDGNSRNPLPRTRRHYWDRGASRVSSTFVRGGETASGFDYTAGSTFGLVDAFELLNRNGLNNPNTTQLEDTMSVVLRRDATESDSFLGSNSTVTARNWNQRQFWENDIRKHLTPFSGAMSVRRPDGRYNSANRLNEPRQPKLDINEAVTTTAGLAELEEVIFESLRRGGASSNDLINRYPHFGGDRRQLARQLTVNLADYIDADNALTVRNGVAGFEALPYITEVYTQRMYVAANVTPADPMAMPPTTMDTVQWVTPVNGQGYVIEIGNPYAQYDTANSRWVGRSVSLERIYLKIGNNSSVRLTDLPGIGAANRLDPGEVLLIRHDSVGAGATTASLDDLSNLYAAGDMNVIGVDVTGDAAYRWPANATDVRIELRAESQIAFNQITAPTNWAYSACEVEVPLPLALYRRRRARDDYGRLSGLHPYGFPGHRRGPADDDGDRRAPVLQHPGLRRRGFGARLAQFQRVPGRLGPRQPALADLRVGRTEQVAQPLRDRPVRRAQRPGPADHLARQSAQPPAVGRRHPADPAAGARRLGEQRQ